MCMSLKKPILFFIILLTVFPVLAQDDSTVVTVADILFDSVEQDTITNGAFYDWWRVQAVAGDVLVIDMGGSDGLAPLLGILDEGNNLVARSEDGEPNQSITMDYTVPKDGQYTIVATRVGNQEGTTTGRYAIRLRRANPAQENHSDDQYVDVTFPCRDFEATTAVDLRFSDDPHPGLSYRMTVYGLDGFVPVIRLKFNVQGQDPFETCNTDAHATLTDTFTLPGEDQRTVTQDSLSTVSQLIFNGAEKAGLVDVAIASKDGAPGRYFAVIDGLSIDSAADTDGMDVRMGPLAKLTPLTVYMVAGANSRLDPYMSWISGNMDCDDAGRGDCKQVPAIAKAGVTLHEGDGMTIMGDRSDAGLVLAPGTTDFMSLVLGSRSNDTYGTYSLFLIGELPALK